jgi:hypothetical protein
MYVTAVVLDVRSMLICLEPLKNLKYCVVGIVKAILTRRYLYQIKNFLYWLYLISVYQRHCVLIVCLRNHSGIVKCISISMIAKFPIIRRYV